MFEMQDVSELNWSLTDWENSKDAYEELLNNSDNWSKVPLLNIIPNHELHDQQLVRFRGMIQNMGNPEYFLSQFEVVNHETNKREMRSGRYRDILQCVPGERVVETSENVIEERQILYCITTPALNDWVSQEDMKFLKLCRPQAQHSPQTSTSSKKRPIDGEMSMDVDACPSTSSAERSDHDQKRMTTDTSRIVIKKEVNSPNLNFPINSTCGVACLVKIYDPDSSLRLNDVVEVVGFLSIDPALSSLEGCASSDNENQAQHPPSSLVPRLHALRIRRVIHSNAMPSDLGINVQLQRKIMLASLYVNSGEIFKTARNIRKELHLALSQVLLGDTLAADYLLCHLLSLVHMRKDGIALGHLSLNISHLPNRPDYTRLLYSILMRLLPKSHYLAMSLDNLNSLSYIPKMDYEENRLSSGLLQLSNNTHLVIDETRLETGKLDSHGVKNVEALKTLVSQQIVNYDFQYYSKPFDVDIPVLVLSEGKSLLSTDVIVPLCLDPCCLSTLTEIFQATNHFLREPLLTSVRMYLAAMKHSSHEFPDDVQKKAQEDFVEMRRVNGTQVSGDDLHLLLVLARLISLSYGECKVTMEAWEQAKKLEEERKLRIKTKNPLTPNPSNEP